MSAYTGWDLKRCNRLRRGLRVEGAGFDARDLAEFRIVVPEEVVQLFDSEQKWTFCRSHLVAWGRFTKQTAILKTLHRDMYLGEIRAWEQKHGLRWDDIGARWKGVSLLQN